MRHLRSDDDDDESPAAPHSRSPQKPTGVVSRLLSRAPYGSVVSSLFERWWRRHPANAVGQLARPILGRLAREQPLKLMATAAGVGALIVLIKPWRLLSVTALLATALKTSDIADMVTTLMKRQDEK